MILIIGVRFRKSGKVYYFAPNGLDIKKGDHVIVETARGIEYGLVVLGQKEVTDDKVVQPLKDVIRIATESDYEIHAENEEKEKEAYKICLEKIAKHELQMKLIDCEYTFDKNKLLFYFTADGRIDFRELVKDLASIFRTRIELRQIGVRDETKLIGGIGICGRPLCCHTYLSDFAPVSIKMAKEQNLSLNPSKISGVCGRLMCCLKNEEEAYEYLNAKLPHINEDVKTIDGYNGIVQSVSVLKQLVKVIITKDNDEKEVREYHVDDLKFEKSASRTSVSPGQALPDEELDENALKELEQMENLNSTTVNTSAYSLVGKTVKIEQTSGTGQVTEMQGTVDKVTIKNNKAYVQVNGDLYSYDDISEVIDSSYLISQYIPKVSKQTVTYLHGAPQDVVIKGVSLGSNGYQAASIGIGLIDSKGNTTKVDASKLSYKDGVLTIDKSAFASLDAGTYTIGFVFDDANSTVDASSVTLVVKGIKETTGDNSSSDKTDTDKSDNDSDGSTDTDNSTAKTE